MFKPTLKACEHNLVAHASMAPDNGHLLEELGWITCVAWKKQQKRREEMKKTKAQRTGQVKHDTRVVGSTVSLGGTGRYAALWLQQTLTPKSCF